MLDLRSKYLERYQELSAFHELFPTLQLPKVAEKKATEIARSSHDRIVFVDGFLAIEHSHIPEEIVCLPMDEAMRSYGIFLQNQMTRTIREEMDPFAALNGANAGLGAFVYIPPKMQASFQIEHYFTGGDLASPRILFSLGKHSHLEIQQHWTLQEHFVNAHIDAVLDVGAKMVLKNTQKTSSATHFHSVRASLKKDAHFTFRLYSEGAKLSRYSVKVQLLEENAETLLQGISRLDDTAQSHVHTSVEHLAPHTQSRQHFKGLLKGKSHSSFEGKIFVHPIAQKTQGYQLCNHLLMSDQATVNVKPNLEIFADDVKASHGATLGQLDEEALFYLTSRGIALDDAKQYLIKGFIQELAECLP